ncbi:MAG: metallophosphoesterase [Lewinellaceae bacterium]|nr:metallophosphoesterase [Lewinellaceae bacterium]
MRSFPLYTILLLCVCILLVDTFAFYWLKDIIQPFPPWAKNGIFITFWTFSAGLITSILLLKIRMNRIPVQRKYFWISSLYGLTVSSFLPKFIFVLAITILYLSQSVLSKAGSLIVVPVAGVLFGFLPFFVIINGIFRTLYRFKVHRLKVEFEDLPKPFNGLRIVHISDLHLGSFNYRYHILDRAIRIINQLEPDFIFFTGDLVNNFAWELKGWESTLYQLSAKRGKYAVLGNHDYGDYSQWESDEAKAENFEEIKYFFKKTGFSLLLNEAEVIEKEGAKIAIAGVENWGHPPFKQYGNLKKALKDILNIPFKILLSHDPTHWKEEVIHDTNIALTLSGHTHGMQAGIDLKNRKWSPIKYKYEHWAGLYEQGGQYLYVTRGLGWLGFPGRLGMRPEVTCLELRCDKNNR